MQRFTSTLGQACFAFLALVAMAATGQAAEPEVQGGRDHPLLTRFAGSRLTGYFHTDWGQTVFPLSLEGTRDDSRPFAKPDSVEGEITRLVYLGPRGKSALEVFRNYEQALKAAGFVQKFHCELNCGTLMFHWRFGPVAEQFKWAEGHLQSARDPGRLWGYADAIALDEGRLTYGTIKRGDRVANVLVYTSIAGYEEVEASSTLVEIAEPKAMQTGQVTVNADALAKGLAAEGKIALYGVFFDTGKAVLKPESDAQLKEMAQLLAKDRALKVFIVGHTDNQGVFEENLKLSLARAQAVRDALVMRHQVDGARLTPYGVANTSPLASNAGEEGRARNRRVELVVR